MRDHNHSFSGLAAAGLGMMPLGMQMADRPGPTELVQSIPVSGNYFQVLGVEPAIGRLFTPDMDKTPGGSPYAVLSYDYWRSRFQGDPQVLGKTLRLTAFRSR